MPVNRLKSNSVFAGKNPLAFVLAFIPPALILATLVTKVSKVPFLDQWCIPTQQFSELLNGGSFIRSLFIQQSETIKATSALLWIGLAHWGWDARIEVLFAFFLFLLGYAIYLKLLVRTGLSESPRSTLFMATASWILFTPFALPMWVWGINVENAVLFFLIFLGILVLNRYQNRLVVWGSSAAISTLATFTFLSGFTFWVFLCPLIHNLLKQDRRLINRKDLLCLTLYVASAAAVAMFYFHGYTSMSARSPLLDVVEHPFVSIQIFLGLIGAQLAFPWPDRVGLGIILGLLTCLVFCSKLLCLIRDRERFFDLTFLHPCIALGLYSLLSLTMITIGRVNQGVYISTACRYYNHTIPIHLATIALLMLYGKERHGFSSLLNKATTAIGLAIYLVIAPLTGVVGWFQSYKHVDSIYKETRLGESALSLSGVAPNNQELKLIAYTVEPTNRDGKLFLEKGLIKLPLLPSDLSKYSIEQVHAGMALDVMHPIFYDRIPLRITIDKNIADKGAPYLFLSSNQTISSNNDISFAFPLNDESFVSERTDKTVTFLFYVPHDFKDEKDISDLNAFVIAAIQ